MSQQDIKQIKGASQGSILFLGTNNTISEDYNKLNWDQNIDQLNITGNIKIIDGNQQSGYILSSDVDGLASWVAPVGSVTGIGVLNYIPRWTDISTLSSTGSIYDTGDFIGIGITSSADTKLHILDIDNQLKLAYSNEYYTYVTQDWDLTTSTFKMEQWTTTSNPVFLMSGGGGSKNSIKLSLRPNVDSDSWNILNQDVGGKKIFKINYGVNTYPNFQMLSNGETKLGSNDTTGSNVGIGLTNGVIGARLDVFDSNQTNGTKSIRVTNNNHQTLLDLRSDGELHLLNYIFPLSDGLTNQVLTTDGFGQLSFATSSSHKLSWVFSGARKTASSSDRDMSADGKFTNISPYIIPVDCKLERISAGSKNLNTWQAHVYKNGVTSALLQLTSATSSVSGLLSITFSSGDSVRLRQVSGINVKSPRILAFFKET